MFVHKKPSEHVSRLRAIPPLEMMNRGGSLAGPPRCGSNSLNSVEHCHCLNLSGCTVLDGAGSASSRGVTAP